MNKDVISTWSKAVESFKTGKDQESIESFHRLAEFSKAQFNIGSIYQSRGKYDLAMQYYTAALEIDPFLTVAYLQRSEIYMTHFEDYEKAFEELSRVVELLLVSILYRSKY
jgi:tetratricopeptide (TPR) repeat protein